MRIAPDKKTLKKRTRRFFEHPPYERRVVTSLIRELESVANVYIFGGLVRDLALYGIANFNSDVDIVIEPYDKLEFLNVISKYEFEKNKFGGFRLKLNRWLFDIWEFETTWAFKENYIAPLSSHSLIETSFFNWDAIFYDVNKNKIICANNYFDETKKGLLDINFEKNPNQIGALVRTLRFIEKDNAQTKPKLTNFIIKMFGKFDDEAIILYELKHCRDNRLNARFMKNIRSVASTWDGAAICVWKQKDQLELSFAV